MSDKTVNELSEVVGIPVERLLEQIKEAGLSASSADDVIGEDEIAKLLAHLRQRHGKTEAVKINISLDDILNADSLHALNDLLTQLMAKQQIQSLIKDSNLDAVVESIIRLAKDADGEKQLLFSAMLGRLAAVARGREMQVFNRVQEVIIDEPPSLDALSDQLVAGDDKDLDVGKSKQYAAQSLRHVDAFWLNDYCLREALNIDTAELARRELLETALNGKGNFSDWLASISQFANVLQSIENNDTRVKRIRRLFNAILEIVKNWQGELGHEPGTALANCFKSFTDRKLAEGDLDAMSDVLDTGLAILGRLIEIRFSNALYAQTYAVMEQGKSVLGAGIWARFLDKSNMISRIRTELFEAALVLARQNRTDSGLMSVLLTTYSSKPQLSAAIKRHFAHAQDLDPDTCEWWQSASKTGDERREVEHKVGNTEDEQIGALLIEVEYAKETMEKLSRAVAPMLEISDPVLAETVKRAASTYQDMAQIARRLARMRKLTKSGLLGVLTEYNPREHEMRGGHKPGIRRIKVIRDGIIKEFNGKKKTLVKPLVEPDE
jgi:hypothetical protein